MLSHGFASASRSKRGVSALAVVASGIHKIVVSFRNSGQLAALLLTLKDHSEVSLNDVMLCWQQYGIPLMVHSRLPFEKKLEWVHTSSFWQLLNIHKTSEITFSQVLSSISPYIDSIPLNVFLKESS